MPSTALSSYSYLAIRFGPSGGRYAATWSIHGWRW